MTRDPSRIFVDLPRVRIAALDYGEPVPGAVPAVLLHGQADLAWSMDPVARRLTDRYRVVSLDLRGHGESGHPGGYSLMDFIGDLRGVLDQLGLERPVLVGHSLGGQVAAQFSGLFPETPRALVVAEGIGPPVRLSGAGPSARLARARGAVLLGGQHLRSRPMADVAEAAARLQAVHALLDAERAAFLASVATRPLPDGGVAWRFDPYTRHWLLNHDPDLAEERWAAVTCPVLVVTGAEAWERWWKDQAPAAKVEGWSGFDPDETARRVARFADVEHHELTGAGHMLPYDAPDRLAALVEDFFGRRLRSTD